MSERNFTVYLIFVVLFAIVLITSGCAKEEGEAARMVIDMEGYGITGRGPAYEASYAGIYGLMKKYPNVDIGAKTNLRLEAHYDSGRLMGIAGGTAPDVFYITFHEAQPYAREGFLHPLDEYVGSDENRNGILDDDEIKWPEWKKLHPLATLACIQDGHVWAMPGRGLAFFGFIYRRDLFAKAGLDPNIPPKDWDELFEYAQKLTFPRMKVKGAKYQRGQQGLYLSTYPHEWFPYFWSAGGDLVLQGKKNPRTGHITWFKKEARVFKDEETGEDLAHEPSIWKATFASEAGVKALKFLQKLRWQRWTRCPDTNEPFNLPQDAKPGDTVTSPHTKKQHIIPEEDIYVGVIRVANKAEVLEPFEVFNKGEVAMQITYMYPYVASQIELSPEQYSCAPIPAGPSGMSITNQQPVYFAIAAHVKEKKKRDICWELLTISYDEETRNKSTKILADAGLYQFLNPQDLLDAGLKNYYDELQPFWKEQYSKILAHSRPEAFNEGWTKVQSELFPKHVFSRIFLEEDFDPRKALEAAETEANERIFRGRDLAPYRLPARVVVGLIFAVLLFLFIQVFRSARESARSSSGPGALAHKRRFRIVPWLIMAPALLSLFIWAYYPLAKGLVMAFQDYHISKESPVTGLDNFISIFLLKGFYKYLLNTVYYIGLTVILGFIAPIILGILLSELLVGKYFYRIMYYLPQVTSAPVIALLWKLMYEPTENGFFNQVFITLHLVDPSKPLQWLNDSRFAMLCIVISAVWASVGAASIIYLAALKSVPDDLYEAADVDGAGTWSKIWRITLPQLKPLIVINFVGAFVGAFQATQNILLMTGGGPGDATTTLSIAIWLEAFVYLRFGSATAMAWVLGTLLIGFTVFQLRYLKKVEFRRATEM